MHLDKPVLSIEVEMQNIEQVKELLPQIATLQKKYTVDLKINMYSNTFNFASDLADRIRSKS